MRDLIPMAVPYIGDEEAEAVYRQVRSGWITMGKRVQEFEEAIAEYVGVRHAVAMNSGTATLHAALVASGVRAGDDVLVPCLSYVSSANAILYCGASPVFVEEDPLTFTVGKEEIEKRITPKTKAVMVVDLKGLPVDYNELIEVSTEHGIALIADSAESFGAKYRDNLIGSQALVHSFSMFANKTITCGEGGFVTTDNEHVAAVCRTLRNQGQAHTRYVHDMIGHNYRLTDIAAAFALEQLKRVEWFIAEKQRIAERYFALLSGCPLLRLPHIPEYVTRHSWYAYSISLDKSVNRPAMLKEMTRLGVDYRLSFPPIPLQPAYQELFGFRDGDFPRAEAIYGQFLDIPCWVGMDDGEVMRVAETVVLSAEKASKWNPTAPR